MPTIANLKWKLKREKTTTGREYEGITEPFKIITVQQLFLLMFFGYLKKKKSLVSSNSLCLLTLSNYSIWSLLWLILPTNTVSLNSPCKNMHFTLIILVGKCVAFFSSWVSDLYVLICGSASALHVVHTKLGVILRCMLPMITALGFWKNGVGW